MATPAINYGETAIGYRDREIWWGPDGPYSTSIPTLVFDIYRQRPASVSNPVRPDKTRGPSSFHHYWWAASPIVGIMDSQQGSTRVRVTGSWSLVPRMDQIMNGGYDAATYDAAVLDLLKNLKRSKVNLGTALAEARKTAELLGKTSTTISKGLDEFMAKNWRRLGKMASWRKVPAKYLELCYGWAPLLNDVYGSAESLSYMMELGYDASFTARGSAKFRDTREEISAALDTGNPVLFRAMLREQQSFSCVAILPNNLLPVFSSLGLTNPLEVAWELVPYSFVLDWVVPIGNWLSVLDAASFCTFKEGSYSRIQRYRGMGWDIDASYPFEVKRAFGQNTIRGGRFDRSVLYDWPAPPIFPRLRSPLSLDKMAKGLSLLAATFAKWR